MPDVCCRDYLDEMCKAMTKDGVKVTTYYAWSLLDNFEVRRRRGAVRCMP